MHGYVSNLYVRPEHRGRGTGGALLAAAMQECDDRRLDAVILWPTPESRSLYERHGFAVRDDLMERRRVKPALDPAGRRRVPRESGREGGRRGGVAGAQITCQDAPLKSA
jgi:hypothetical protein